MPRYDRLCGKCDELWEVTCKISEKENAHNCPYCDSTDGTWMIGTSAISTRPDRLMTKKASGFSEVIAKIQERNRRTEICER